MCRPIEWQARAMPQWTVLVDLQLYRISIVYGSWSGALELARVRVPDCRLCADNDKPRAKGTWSAAALAREARSGAYSCLAIPLAARGRHGLACFCSHS